MKKHRGTLTYSVCSPLPALAAETTDAVAAFLERQQPAFEIVPVDAPALLPYAADCDRLGERSCVRTWTHRHPADSHFACKMVRRRA